LLRDPTDAVVVLIEIFFACVADDHLGCVVSVANNHFVVWALEEGAMILSFIVLLVLLDRRQLFGTKGRLVVVLVV